MQVADLNMRGMIDQILIFLVINFTYCKMLLNLHPVSTSITMSSISLLIIMYSAIIILCTDTVLILYNAGPLDVSWAISSDKVVAILDSFLPGQVNNFITMC